MDKVEENVLLVEKRQRILQYSGKEMLPLSF